MGLFAALNLKPPKRNGASLSARAKDLTDADFSADAKGRAKSDAQALERGRQAIAADAERIDGQRDDAQPGLVEKQVDGAIKAGIEKAGEKARELNKATMPRLADVFEPMSAEEEFLYDMAQGLKSAKEHVEFIQKRLEYAEKFGDATALAPIAEASKNLQKITKGVLGGLGTAGKVISTTKEIVVFYQSLERFAKASNDMSAGNGESVQAWVDSLKSVWNAAKPFVDKFKDKAFEAALGGSELAGAACATLAIVGAELYIGLQVLDQGVKNVNAYFKRLNELTAEDRDRMAAQKHPEPPQPPLPFNTRQETIASLKQSDERRLRLQEQKEQARKQQEQEAAAARAIEDFNEKLFPKLYLKYRPMIFDKIYAAYRAAGGGGGSDASDWWDCLVPDDAPVEYDEDDPGDGPSSDGIDIEPRKRNASLSDATIEVRQFLELRKKCPYFETVYQGELAKRKPGR